MRAASDRRRIALLTALSLVTSGAVILMGGLVLLGWHLDVPTLTSILPGRVAMNPTTALAFALAAGSLWLSPATSSVRGDRIRSVASAAAGLVMLIGLVTLAGYAVGKNLGLDQILFGTGPLRSSPWCRPQSP
jgi:hypothetical protein